MGATQTVAEDPSGEAGQRPVRVRLAPSPTGTLHIGTARTAVFNWLFARRQGGQFLLRIEDTDKGRSKPEFTANILEGLAWLGLHWDAEPVIQSSRLGEHRAAIQQLLDAGHAYRCFASEAELTAMREQQAAHKQAPRYDNRHRDLSAEQQQAYIAEGARPRSASASPTPPASPGATWCAGRWPGRAATWAVTW